MRRLLMCAAVLALGVSGVSAVASAQPNRQQSGAQTSAQPSLTSAVTAARAATAKYEHSLARARADGYGIITRMIPNMGYHFLNGKISGFNVRRPAILVYEHRGSRWQLGALEWVFTSMPSRPPLPGATYGVFGAACHYVDGTFVFADAQSMCASTSPTTGAAFSFWHPRLITLHFWVWYPNPSGMYMGTNPLVAPYS